MTDIVDKKTRSRMMSGIRSKDTTPELIVRRFLHNLGFRYKLHDRAIAGRPDIVLPKYNVVIFVNGCFWHRHMNCKLAYVPKTNLETWKEKFAANINRDLRCRQALLKSGWRVITIWECGLRWSQPDLTWLPAAIRLTSGENEIHWP